MKVRMASFLLVFVVVLAMVSESSAYNMGNLVWWDLNGDGLQNRDHQGYCDDPGEIIEPGIEGVTVNLYKCDGEFMATTTTDVEGYYYFGTPGEHCGRETFGLSFNGMPASFFVEFELPDGFAFTQQNVPGDDNDDSDADPVTGQTHCILLSPGTSLSDPERKLFDASLDAGLVENPQEPCGECLGKVTQLTLQYNGTAAAEVVVMRKVGKRDDPEEGIVFMGMVEPGAQFTFDGNDKHGTLGTEITIYVNDVFNTKIHTSCSQPIGPGLISGDFEVIEGYSLYGGLLCPADVPPSGDECDCEGKVSQLTLQYNGTAAAEVVVIRKVGKKDNDPLVFMGMVEPGAQFTFNGNDKNGTLGTEITIYVDDVLNTKIHTSCSQPIGPGLIRGDFEVIEGYSLKGGLLCQIP